MSRHQIKDPVVEVYKRDVRNSRSWGHTFDLRRKSEGVTPRGLPRGLIVRTVIG